MKKFNVIIGGIILIYAGSCTRQPQEKVRLQTVKTDTVTSAAEHSTLQYPGKVRAAENASLAFRVSGTIRKIYAKEGSKVKKGQLLAELDPTDYRIQLNATEAEYKQVKSEAERVMALYKDGGTTPAANDKAVYGLKQITAKYTHHKDQLAYTKLYAPFEGYIDKHMFDTHETVGAGMPVITMIGSGQPEVEINLPATEYIRREQFRQYYCTLDIYPGMRFTLTPLHIIPKANANQLYSMRLKWDSNNPEQPSPGMNTMVTIVCECAADAPMSAPSTAILHEKGETCVFIFDAKNKKVHKRSVDLVRLQTDGRATFTSSQVKTGDIIVSSGVHHIQDGESVTQLPPASATNIGGLL